MYYKVYLLDKNNKIAASETFLARDDGEAQEIAVVLYYATRDVCCGYELWHGSQRITSAPLRRFGSELTLAELTEDNQIRAVALEERLQASFACVRRSRRLLEAMADHQAMAQTSRGK